MTHSNTAALRESLGSCAVVLGGSMAGLMAARVLADRFGQVTLLERDSYNADPGSRKGVPQDRHAHALLVRGEQILTRLFPGITDDLVAAGAFRGDMGRMCWFQDGGYKKPHTWGRDAFTQSRPLLEWHVRQRVLSLPNVQAMTGVSVLGLESDNSQVTGVKLREDGAERVLAADLVVDCTGRGSATPRWLEELGYQKPPESSVGVNIGYATRYYRRDPGTSTGKRITLVYPKPPLERRAATLLPIENDRWICTLVGWLGDFPPNDADGFLDFAKSLSAPDIYDVISEAEPLSDPVPHRFPGNLRRHYEKLQRFPGRFLVMGDAMCSFNPVYGQGVTSAAQQSTALEGALKSGLGDSLAKRYFGEAARLIDNPWTLAAGSDFRYPEVRGPKQPGTDLINSYVKLVHRAATKDSRVYSEFLRVMNLLEAPTVLLRPQTLLRVLRGNLIR